MHRYNPRHRRTEKLEQLPCEQCLQGFAIFRAFLPVWNKEGKSAGKFKTLLTSLTRQKLSIFFPSNTMSTIIRPKFKPYMETLWRAQWAHKSALENCADPQILIFRVLSPVCIKHRCSQPWTWVCLGVAYRDDGSCW